MTDTYNWLVIGAGVAGISAVGALIDSGVAANTIAWVDPSFQAGDLHTLWPHVSSNTTVNDFKNALIECAAFNYDVSNDQFPINALDGNHTCQLSNIVGPLQDITKRLAGQVKCFSGKVNALHEGQNWTAQLDKQTIQAEKVILATGSEQKTLAQHNNEQQVVKLEDALNKTFWAGKTQAPIAVFGSSHSAMIIIKNIIENGGKVINFYRSPIRFAKKLANWTLYDNTGLKGATADWVKNLMPQKRDSIERYYSSNDNIQLYLGQCELISYAVGFKPRHIPINNHALESYDDFHGIVANNLFATGIAFPRKIIYPTGYSEHNVGFLKFVRDLKQLMPIWLQS